MKEKLSILFLIFLLRLANPSPIQAAGDYCAPQRPINQWSCVNENINLCDTRWWLECPPDHGTCYARFDGTCNINTSYRCKVINFNTPCTSSPCQTSESFNNCDEGDTWKSSCNIYGSQYRGCWVLAYGCNPDCVRDASSGPYYNDYCDNACGGPTPTPGGPTSAPPTPDPDDPTPIPPTPDPPTPTPTPYIKANLENPEGNPVSREICPVECDAFFGGCLQSNPPACSTNDSYTFPKTMDQWNGSYQGAGVTLSNDIVMNVNPNPGGGQADSDANHHYYSWPDWSDGERQVTFILATPTPDPVINFNLYETDGPNSCTANTNNTSVSPDSFNIELSSGNLITSFSSSQGNFSYSNPEPGPYTLVPASQWICAGVKFGASCLKNICAGPDGETQIDYYVTQIKPAWWQTKGGNVHVESNVNVDIPPGLDQQLSLSDNGAVGIITSNGPIDNNLIDTWQYSDDYGFNFNDNPIDYEFFWLQAGGPNTADPGFTGGIIEQTDLNANGVFYGGNNTSFSLDTNTNNWNVTVANNWVVVFIDGDLTIPKFSVESHKLSIGPNGFLAFIVSGDINIEVGHSGPPYDNDDVDLQGIFIADGDINIQGDIDRQFVGKGVFAAGVDRSGSVTFNRDLGIDNNDYPPALFIWDPELVLNAPTILMQNSTSWHEVAPRGT